MRIKIASIAVVLALAGCASEPVGHIRRLPVQTTVPAPSLEPMPEPPPMQRDVRPGAFCAPEGAMGRTAANTLMGCAMGQDGKTRWRAA